MSRLLKQQTVGNWVRRLREDSGMSLRTLASQAGFSPSFMSQVENGLVSPSISSMEKIAEALGVTLGEFFAAAAEGKAALVVRTAGRLRLSSSWSQGEIEALGPMEGSRQLEPVLITLEPGGRSGKHPYTHPSEEFAFVLEGALTLTLGPERHVLQPGDSVTVRPQELRLWENHSDSPLRLLLVKARCGPKRFGRRFVTGK
ncbi:MAG: cupin domain-containing protein [Thermoplasmata archaeon]|nr:cupin domain-containing protein [Thermoplasmata archaeon]